MPPIRLQKPKKTRTAISNDMKKEICEYMMSNNNVKQGDVAFFLIRNIKN